MTRFGYLAKNRYQTLIRNLQKFTQNSKSKPLNVKNKHTGKNRCQKLFNAVSKSSIVIYFILHTVRVVLSRKITEKSSTNFLLRNFELIKKLRNLFITFPSHKNIHVNSSVVQFMFFFLFS